MRDFVVRVHKDNVFTGRMLQRQAFALLHVFAVIIEDNRVVFFCDLARAVGGMRVGQQNFVAVARIGLARDGRQDIVQQRLHIERGHDEADARQIFRTGLHGVKVDEDGGKFKSALRRGMVPAHRDKPRKK